MRSKFGLDFYNKIKVNVLLSNKSSNQDLVKYKKFLKKLDLPKNSEIISTEPFTLKTDIDAENMEESLKNLKEFQEKLSITREDECFNEYKSNRIRQAKKILHSTENYRLKMSSDLSRFPYFLKKLETNESKESSFLDYCPMDSSNNIPKIKKVSLNKKQNLKLNLPLIEKNVILHRIDKYRKNTINMKKRVSLIKLQSSPKSLRKEELKFEEIGPVSDRIKELEDIIYEINQDVKLIKKKSKVLKRKVKRETKSLNSKFGSMLKDLEYLKQ